ncbi:MAG: TolC family protein [Bacteroidota bacterium]
MKKLLLILIITPLLLIAQNQNLTLKDAILIGIKESKILKISEKKIYSSKAKEREQFGTLFPTIKLQSGYNYQSSVPEFKLPNSNLALFPLIQNVYSTKLSIQQPIFTGWKLTSASKITEEQRKISEIEFSKENIEVIFQITTTYWNLYRAQQLEKYALENLEFAKTSYKDVSQYLLKGIATENDLLKANIRITNSEIALSETRSGVATTELVFNILLNKNIEEKYILTSNLTEENIVFDKLQNYISKGIENRKDLLISNKRIESAKLNKNIASSGYYPQMFIQSNYYSSRPNQRYFPLKNELKDSWDIGLLVQYDFWNLFYSYYEVEHATAQIDQSEINHSILKDGIMLEITQNYYSAERSVEKVRLAKLANEQSEENFRITKNKYNNGLVTISELNDAQNIFNQSKIQFIQSLVDQKIAIAKLNKSIGEY